MAFVPDPKQPKFTDLKGSLSQSKQIDNALYQTIQTLLEWLDQLQIGHDEAIVNINNSVNTIFSNVVITPNINATYLTAAYEANALPLSRQLIAGANVIFDDSVANQRIISATGSGTGTLTPHHITHEPGGTDPMAVDAAPTTGSLRTLGTGGNQAAAGNDPRFSTTAAHAPTHSQGGSDPVDVKNLAGYPGGITEFLRADHTFAIPPGGSGGGMNLDYLGNYVSGPVYNDGDIVIGSDGVLYMCTVDGTITPPEPWPGTGVAVNGTIDATYWVVSPHSLLTNERAMNGLGTGYVRSTVGEPSVVPTIPLTDTTGILPDNRLTSNVALKNIDNLFVAQTFASNSWIKGPTSALYFSDTASPVDSRVWRFINYNTGNLYLDALNDANTVILKQFVFGRNGAFIASSFWGDGYNVSNIYAPNVASGTLPIGRLGTNAPAANTYLRGDNTWAPVDAFPSGLIVLSVSPCPVGWTRIAWDGYFMRGGTAATVGTTGGAASHAHTLGNLQIPAHDHGGQISGTVDADGNHSHPFSGSGAGSTGTSLGGTSGADAGGSFTAPYAAHTHDFSVTVSGQTGDGGFHAHNFRTGIPSQGAISVVGGMDAAGNLPPYVDIYYCQKN